jgi:GNAT superfamily N-acetyltransferase
MDGCVVAEIVIRAFTKADADAVSQMWLALVEHHRQLDWHLPAAAPGGEHRYVRRIIDHLDDPLTRSLIAEIDGEPVGFALGMIVDLMQDIFAQEPSGFLADIYVEPFARRHGVGRALVQDLIQWFRSNKITALDWQVSVNNPEGMAFWEAIGGQGVMLRMRAQIGEE